MRHNHSCEGCFQILESAELEAALYCTQHFVKEIDSGCSVVTVGLV